MKDIEERSKKLYNYVTTFKGEILRLQFSFLESNIGSLNLKDLSVLMLIGRIGSCNMNCIAENLSLALSTTTSIVDRMVRNKLVKRARTEKDRRIVLVSLTEKGREIDSLIYTKAIHFYNLMLSRLTVEEQKSLLHIFKKMTIGGDDTDKT